MNPRERIFEPHTFDRVALECPKCKWHGTGSEANIADFYGLAKFKQVNCPKCDAYLGNLPRDNYRDRGILGSQSAP